FTTPFTWDGISNIVVEVVYSNNNSGGSSSTVRTYNSGYTTTLGIYADNATAQAVLTATSSTGLGSLSSNTTNTNRPVMTFGFTAICASPRTEVVATIISAPDLALSESNITICEGETSTIVTIAEGAGDYDTFEWSPNTGVSGDAVNGWTFNPVETIVYTLTV